MSKPYLKQIQDDYDEKPAIMGESALLAAALDRLVVLEAENQLLRQIIKDAVDVVAAVPVPSKWEQAERDAITVGGRKGKRQRP